MLIAALLLDVIALLMSLYGLVTAASYGKTLTYHDLTLPMLAAALLLALLHLWKRPKP